MSSDDASGGWQLTESDPAVFTELLRTLKVPLIVDDLYSLEPESLAALEPLDLHALIFLFKWVPGSSDDVSDTSRGEYDPEFPGFFAHQVVNNACATLAVINAIGNIPSLPMGSNLSNLLSFAKEMDPQSRGLVVTSADWLREAHNVLSPPNPYPVDDPGSGKKAEAAYHFVVYLPYLGTLYELDGLKEHAIRHGSFEDLEGKDWVGKARETIEARINTYPMGDLEFCLLAIRGDPLPVLESQLQKLYAAGGNAASAADLERKISIEKSKRDRWAFENSLRRHNFVGFMHAITLELAKSGRLSGIQKEAEKSMQAHLAKGSADVE